MKHADLIAYLCQQFGIDEVTPMMTRQLKKFVNENRYTYAGIASTVKYCVLYKEPPIELKVRYGLGFVPSYYREAKAFYKHQREVASKMAGIDPTTVGETRVVTIKESDRQKMRFDTPLIDMETLGGYDDE